MELATASSLLHSGEALLLIGGIASLMSFRVSRAVEKYGQAPPRGTGPWYWHQSSLQLRWLWLAFAVVGLVLTIIGLF